MSEEVEGRVEGREEKGRGGERELIYAIILDQSMANTYLQHKRDMLCGYHDNKRDHQMVTMATMSCRKLCNNSLCSLVALVSLQNW